MSAASTFDHAMEPLSGDSEDRFVDLPNGIRLCYRVTGPEAGETVLLLAGLGLQLTYWPLAFIDALTGAGYRVVTPDNRDAGRSSRMGTRPPGKLSQFLAKPPADNYSIEDMADDMAHLLQALAMPRLHVVGMSMGGMIAQAMASRHPDTIASLSSIFSTTGRSLHGQPAASTLWRIATSGPVRSSSQAVERYAAMQRHIGEPHSPGIEAVWAAYALQAWERSGQRANASGIARQIGAIQKSGDRTAELRRITAPTLVLHGDVDLMVHPSGGRATADAIPGARHEVILGMRHQIDATRSPELVTRILSHIRQSGAASTRTSASTIDTDRQSP